MSLKSRPRDRFDKAADSYDQAAKIQKESAHLLITELLRHYPNFVPRTILDLGTGTGMVVERLLPHFGSSYYTLNDISPSMLHRAASKFRSHKQHTYYLGDMETSLFNAHDLIISNLSFQWVSSFFITLEKFFFHSQVLAFSCLLQGTFDEWYCLLRTQGLPIHSLPFPREPDITSFLNKLKPEQMWYTAKDIHISFPNAYACMRYLKSLGAHFSPTSLPLGPLRTFIVTHDQKITLSYRIFYAILRNKACG